MLLYAIDDRANSLLETTVLLVDAPDAGEVDVSLHLAVDQVVVLFVRDEKPAVDDVAVLQPIRASRDSRREATALHDPGVVLCTVGLVVAALVGEGPRVLVVDRHPRPNTDAIHVARDDAEEWGEPARDSPVVPVFNDAPTCPVGEAVWRRF